MKRVTNQSNVIDVDAKETLLSKAVRRFQSNQARGAGSYDRWNFKQGTGNPYKQAFREIPLRMLLGTAMMAALVTVVHFIG